MVEPRRGPCDAPRASDLDPFGVTPLEREPGLAKVRAPVGQHVDTMIREEAERSHGVRHVQPAFDRAGAIDAQGITVEEHPDGWSDGEVSPPVLARQLHFQDLRARAIRGFAQREAAPDGERDTLPGHPCHGLDDRTIADDDPAIRVARAERDLHTIGDRSLPLRKFLFRRIRRVLYLDRLAQTLQVAGREFRRWTVV